MIFNYLIKEDISLLAYLQSFYLSKPKIYTLFLEKRVMVNGLEGKRDSFLAKGDVLSIMEDEDIDFIPQSLPLDIVYEDDYLLIINKPSNLIIYPESKDGKNTLVNIVASYFVKKGYNLTVKYAHRLDRDTTGLIIFCKDMLSMSYFNHYISTHEIRREYLLLTNNHFTKKSGIINAPIGEDRHINGKRRVSKTGQEAITHYEVLKNFENYSLVKALLETGRTHQIRVHLASIGHPLLGDTLYGGSTKEIARVALHSASITFVHPVTKEKMIIEKEMPFDMASLIK